MKRTILSLLTILMVGILVGCLGARICFPRVENRTQIVEKKVVQPGKEDTGIETKYSLYEEEVKQFKNAFSLKGFTLNKDKSDLGNHVIFIDPEMTFTNKKVLSLTGEQFNQDGKNQVTETDLEFNGEKCHVQLSLIFQENPASQNLSGFVGGNRNWELDGGKTIVNSSAFTNQNLLVLCQITGEKNANWDKTTKTIQVEIVEALKQI